MKKKHLLIIPVIIIILDQLTKYGVRAGMSPGERIPIIGDWLSIYYVQNTGTAFSMFEGNKFVTLVLTSLLIIICIVYAIYEAGRDKMIVPALLIMIASGGASNMIDRIMYGYVTDMISCGSFAVFNVADIFVTSGSVLMIITLILMFRRGEEL